MSLTWLKLDEKRLSQQWIFRLAIAIPFTISFLLCIPLWFETTFDFSSSGYARFLLMYSLPIGVLSLSIPLVAIIAHIHRTIQTEKQIQLTDQKNISDRFYSHYKYITESLSSVESSNIKTNGDIFKLKISNINSLYRSFFPHSSPENGVILDKKTNYATEISSSLNKIDKKLKALEGETSRSNIILFEMLIEITSLSRHLNINTHEISSNQNNRKLLFIENNTKFKISTFFLEEEELKDYLKNLYSMSITIMNLLDIKFDYYPNLSNYAFKNKEYHFSSSFKKMKKTSEPFNSFHIGELAFTSEEFDDFNSYLTQ
ncbi:hypothetical protein J5069_15380 [Candidatus Symbiopectobacterium sp. NZEC127]|uniref:hypothetical protein n=1 Tax=Candidatus Symbiopectobacterium sp. NZEC127 TaxID=2820472 RepID=UPI002226E96D|nr:hypothetical protein [Candidatus Symbiopectobacterium sp. NZEC127]MCW2487279.1 hypothetical protein [Candidatus Symbiopectobacterium sp. NZEC127]